jgi:hypothetical protein
VATFEEVSAEYRFYSNLAVMDSRTATVSTRPEQVTTTPLSYLQVT